MASSAGAGAGAGAGVPAPGAPAAKKTKVASPDFAYARLVNTKDKFDARVTELPCVLGRGMGNDDDDLPSFIKIHDLKVSRHHAKLVWDAKSARFIVEVLGKNGVTIDQTFYKKGAEGVSVKHNSAMKIGSRRFFFQLPHFKKPTKPVVDLVDAVFKANKPKPGDTDQLSIDDIATALIKKYQYYRDGNKHNALKQAIRAALKSGDQFEQDQSTGGSGRKRLLFRRVDKPAAAGNTSSGSGSSSGSSDDDSDSDSGDSGGASAAASSQKRPREE